MTALTDAGDQGRKVMRGMASRDGVTFVEAAFDAIAAIIGREPTADEVELFLGSEAAAPDVALGARRLARLPPEEHAIPDDLARAPIFSPRRRGEGFVSIGRIVSGASFNIWRDFERSMPGEPLPADSLLVLAYAVRLFCDGGCRPHGLVRTSERKVAGVIYGSTGGVQLRRVRDLLRRLATYSIEMTRANGEHLIWHPLDLYYRDPSGELVLRLPFPISDSAAKGRLAYLNNPLFRKLLRANPYSAILWKFFESHHYPSRGRGWYYSLAELETLLCIERWPERKRRQTAIRALERLADIDRHYRICVERTEAGRYRVAVWYRKQPSRSACNFGYERRVGLGTRNAESPCKDSPTMLNQAKPLTSGVGSYATYPPLEGGCKAAFSELLATYPETPNTRPDLVEYHYRRAVAAGVKPESLKEAAALAAAAYREANTPARWIRGLQNFIADRDFERVLDGTWSARKRNRKAAMVERICTNVVGGGITCGCDLQRDDRGRWFCGLCEVFYDEGGRRLGPEPGRD